MTEVFDVRAIINLKDGETEGDPIELSDEAIEGAITRADKFIAILAARSGVSLDIVDLAKLNYAAYLAYQTYADRIVEELPGSFDQTGVFQPISNPVAKQVMAKLAGLKETSDETIELIRNTPIEGTTEETPVPSDQETYPDQFKLSNLDSDW